MQPEPARADSRTLAREIASAYIYSAARIGSWGLLSAWVYRSGGALDFGLLALVRGTIGILNYTSLGLAPAMIRLLALSRNAANPTPLPIESPCDNILAYQSPPPDPSPEQVVFTNGLLVALVSACVGIGVMVLYGNCFERIFTIPSGLHSEGTSLVFAFGTGMVIRLLSEAPGAFLQTRECIALDNWLLAGAEVIWVILSCLIKGDGAMNSVAVAYVGASVILLVARFFAAHRIDRTRLLIRSINGRVLRQIFSIGILIWFAQLADYLYAPMDYVLIGHFLNTYVASIYSPAVQIDGGLLVIVSGLASVLLPRAALAHAAEDSATVRHYYIRGTLASFILLTVVAAIVWALSPWIFQLWLGDTMLATRAILPLMLVNTVIGGSSAVGRSILLGMGRVKPFTVSVIIAGATNVFVSWALVRYCGMGLRGIILGTVIAVVGRCALWMPWYVVRSIRETSNQPPAPVLSIYDKR